MAIEAKVEVRKRNPGDRNAHKRGIVYFSHEGENVLENFGNRVARPSDLYKTFLPAVIGAADLPLDTRFVWSQKAGCPCGCSPGFVCRELRGYDVWVSLKGAPNTSNDPDALALAEMRKEGLARQLHNEQIAAKMLTPPISEDEKYVEQLEALLARD